MVEYLVAIGLSLATAYLLQLLGLRSFERVLDALAQLVGGWREAGWPTGVQEEDRDSPWGRIRRTLASNRSIERPVPPPTLVRVQPTIRSR
jgi:hypothetical protein